MKREYSICPISKEELQVPPEKWTEEDRLSMYYCDIADAQLTS